jgi:D-serine deaminase-like pyridoxal phosphate-dependent protein
MDAGALSLSKDIGPQHVSPPPGMGVVKGHPELIVSSLSQEHGIVRAATPEAMDRKFKVGERIEIVPNHSCLTVAHFDEYHVVAEGRVVERWKIDRAR